MTSAPAVENDDALTLFLDEEKQAADTIVGQLAGEDSNVYCLRMRNLDHAPHALETVLAGYLLTNAVLMSRTPRRIRKLVSFGTADPAMLYSYANVLRGLLQGSFTSLSQVDAWQKLVLERWEIAGDLTGAVADAVRLFETSGISSSAAAYHRADILLGVEGHPPVARLGGQFQIDDADVFTPLLKTIAHTYPIQLGDIFRRPGLQLGLGLKGRNVVVDIDCGELDRAMTGWLGNLHHVLELDFYKVGWR